MNMWPCLSIRKEIAASERSSGTIWTILRRSFRSDWYLSTGGCVYLHFNSTADCCVFTEDSDCMSHCFFLQHTQHPSSPPLRFQTQIQKEDDSCVISTFMTRGQLESETRCCVSFSAGLLSSLCRHNGSRFISHGWWDALSHITHDAILSSPGWGVGYP